jgi:hypothetical protein
MYLPVFLFRRDGFIPEEDFGQNADYGKPVQAPIIRFHVTALDQNDRSLLIYSNRHSARILKLFSF